MTSTKVNIRPLVKPELLSPAGDWDCLRAAVENGVDAVYLGVKGFNARMYTRNFTTSDLKSVVGYAHSNGVKIYLTLNTLIKNRELNAFFATLSDVYAAGVDGVIIQHLSFLDIIKMNYPGLRVFISTQGAIGNVASASVVKLADRIILPRELPLDQIKKFVDAGIRTEVFVHGALCYSYSGLCLFSSFVGTRSGNRGSCAQLCRQRYNAEYPLSTKELCLFGRIPELIDAGIEGFKIEGRMRSPLYVAVATRLYRKAIDSHLNGHFVIPSKESEEIEVVFNREFTEGLVFGERRLVSPEKPMNRGAFLGQAKDREISLSRRVGVGDGVAVWTNGQVTGGIIKRLTVDGKVVRETLQGAMANLGLDLADGAKVYLTSSPRIRLKPDFETKRTAIKTPNRQPIRFAPTQAALRRSSKTKIVVKAYSLTEAIESSESGADIVFLNIFEPEFPGPEKWSGGGLLGAYLPRIMDDQRLDEAVDLVRKRSPSALLLGNLGAMHACEALHVPKYVDYSLNVFNDIDISFFKRLGATPVVSPELSLQEMEQIRDKDVAVLCHGDVVLMNTMIDPERAELVDEKGSKLRVRKEDRYWQILNSRPYGVFDAILTLREHGFGQFFIDREGRGADAVRLYRSILSGGQPSRRARKGFTSGHLFKPVD